MVKQSSPHLHIFHIPLGIEDPYMQQPWERTPREPCEGDEVTLHIITRPQGATDAVFIHLFVNDEESGTASATFTSWEGEGDRWIASLGAFHGGTRVSYNIEARSTTGERFVEGPYSFDVSMWHPLNAVTAWQATSTSVLMHMADASGSEALVSFEVLDAGELHFRVWPHPPTTVPETAHGVPCIIHQEEDDLILESGDLRVRIHLTDGSIVLQRGGTQIIRSAQGHSFLTWLVANSPSPMPIRLSLTYTDVHAI